MNELLTEANNCIKKLKELISIQNSEINSLKTENANLKEQIKKLKEQ